MEMGIKRVIVIFLLLTSCAYHTELPCPYRHSYNMTMKKLIEKCDFIIHGSTKKWVQKRQ